MLLLSLIFMCVNVCMYACVYVPYNLVFLECGHAQDAGRYDFVYTYTYTSIHTYCARPSVPQRPECLQGKNLQPIYPYIYIYIYIYIYTHTHKFIHIYIYIYIYIYTYAHTHTHSARPPVSQLKEARQGK